jgi:TolB-like protein
MGGDAEQGYLGEGIAEDLITRLATCRDFPVIAGRGNGAQAGASA